MKTKIILTGAAFLFSGICSAQSAGTPSEETKASDPQPKDGKTKIIVAATAVAVGSAFLIYKLWPKEIIPQVVKDAAKAKFPNATEFEEWEKEGDEYEVEVEQGDDNEMEAKFSGDGTWLSTKQEIKKADLPKAILDALAASKYKDWEIDEEARKIENPENPSGLFMIEVEKGKQEMMLSVSAEGKIMKTETAK